MLSLRRVRNVFLRFVPGYLMLACRALIAFLIFSLPARSQETGIPIFIGRPPTLIAPAVDASGANVVFGSAITPEGASLGTVDIYVVTSDGSGLRRLTRLAGGQRPPQGALAVSGSADGLWAAFSTLATDGRGEEVHLLDVVRAADRTLVVDTQGCIQPLAIDCPACFFACVQTPHLTADGSAVLYAIARQQPFYVVKNDGSSPRNLPVYTGSLAPAPQRVFSRSGLVVFVSRARLSVPLSRLPPETFT